MPRTRIDDAEHLTVADVIHERFTTLPASATVGDVREWFAASSSRRMAILAQDGHYVGSLAPDDVSGDLDLDRPAADVAKHGPTIAPDAPATAGEAVAVSTDARRVPVVDGEGRLLGIVSVTGDRTAFCGTG